MCARACVCVFGGAGSDYMAAWVHDIEGVRVAVCIFCVDVCVCVCV